MKFRYSDRPATIQEILKLIAQSPSGQKLVERFLPVYLAGRVGIEGYPKAITEKLRAVLGEGQPIGACFTTDGKTGMIYLDLESPLGVLAPFLTHEISHSLDSSLWDTKKKSKNLMNTETRAFEIQHRVTTELKERFPDFDSFLKTHFPRAKILHQKLSQLDIAELYEPDLLD